MSYIPLHDAIKILKDGADVFIESEKIKVILEDTNSPINRKYQEKLFQAVIDKKHVDFDNIPDSKGDIRAYAGYNDMINVLSTIKGLAAEQKSNDVLNYVSIVEEAIKNIAALSTVFEKGFAAHNDYVMLEYNTYVFTCVEATSSLLYEFIEYMKVPTDGVIKIKLKNNKMRANTFYFEQLAKFNKINSGTMAINYRKMLENMVNKNANNFFGIDDGLIVGISAMVTVALAIVPVTRELIYQFYRLRGALSNSLELQATFIQMNKACLEANATLTVDKKKKIIDKQEILRKKFIKLAEGLKVKDVRAMNDSKRELAENNKMLSIDSIRDEVSNSPLELM